MPARNPEFTLPAEDAAVPARAIPASEIREPAKGARLANNEWLVGLVLLVIDIVSWVGMYGLISFLRRDLFFVGPFEFVLVDVIQLAVLCQALFMIGGYDPRNDKRSLTYTAEHILAVIGAAAVSSLIVYSAAAYDGSIKPSRGVVLLAFLV